MELMLEDDARDRIRRYVESREWWILPYLNRRAGPVITTIEERHYVGAANADFHVLVGGGGPIMGVAFAHKRRMSARQFARILKEAGDPRKITDLTKFCKTQDVLVVLEEEDQERGIVAAFLFNAWLYPPATEVA